MDDRITDLIGVTVGVWLDVFTGDGTSEGALGEKTNDQIDRCCCFRLSHLKFGSSYVARSA
jgi:hypothetical protein